jgi:hypothetical protein
VRPASQRIVNEVPRGGLREVVINHRAGEVAVVVYGRLTLIHTLLAAACHRRQPLAITPFPRLPLAFAPQTLAFLPVQPVGLFRLLTGALRSLTFTPARFLCAELASNGVELVPRHHHEDAPAIPTAIRVSAITVAISFNLNAP